MLAVGGWLRLSPLCAATPHSADGTLEPPLVASCCLFIGKNGNTEGRENLCLSKMWLLISLQDMVLGTSGCLRDRVGGTGFEVLHFVSSRLMCIPWMDWFEWARPTLCSPGPKLPQ
ncbi:hypothetical protein QBC36DRAFT_332584 [Triangularia setosa]|uniref:Secreted protein n=1 Tax=Triangularia setosa TaxID=2587417 RepID=A0AAN6W5W3_9PEZI|nr:hypothetical protein QBC36DRAFT_332584 [Podospora setosa]